MKETAESLRVSEATVRRAIRAGKLPCVRIGRLVRVSVVDLAAFAATRFTKGAHDGR
ncbi:helix-turn-helix domain-containing protein [Kutzneria sp. CA-103260]|uniref:helix-turn-helix domain-containing protein n=1 Tax=Kutzneria sp. CA-103260 TaxID=2802641 RepID=UPI003FA597C9